MAGDWMKFELSTFDKPEVLQMSYQLGIPAIHVVGCLLKVWSWFGTHTKTGHAHVTLMSHIDTLTDVTNFGQAMKAAGWLVEDGDQIYLPNFDRHNGNCAKKRALATERKRNERSRSERDKSVTREEKRREDNKPPISPLPPTPKPKQKAPKFTKPTVDEVKARISEMGYHVDAEAFVAYYDSVGWKVGKNPMKCWKSALTTWARRSGTKQSAAEDEWKAQLANML